jgi:hypothetical protein
VSHAVPVRETASGLDSGPLLPEVLQTPEDYYADRVAGWALTAFLRFAGQARSQRARDVLIRAASGGSVGLDDLQLWTDGSVPAGGQPLLRIAECRPHLLLALAGLVANQRLADDDARRAIELYRLIQEAHGTKSFARADWLHYLELLAEEEPKAAFDEAFWSNALTARDWVQGVLHSANHHNPWAGRHAPGSVPGWHRLVNSLFTAAGLEPIEVLDGLGDPLDHIMCSPRTTVEDGPLVTVLVPTHNPGHRLGTALSSLLKQTWTNLEILILDDGSDVENRFRIDAWAERDARVRVLRMSRNVGNYAARNAGLDEASGEFVTVHDDDDWSHPRKLELQARNLVANPTTMANLSQMVRATSDLEFTRINSNVSWVQPNYSSLMYRRKDVITTIGYFDEVNRAADAEYRNRLVQATGRVPTVVGGPPMSILRVRSGSLTHGEIQRAHIHPTRRWYDLSSRWWQASVTAGGGQPTLARGSRSAPAFSVAHGMIPGEGGTVSVDVVYATDFRFPGGNSSVSVNEIELLLDLGKSVAMLQLDSPVLVGTTELHPRAAAVALRPRCTVVTTRTDVDAGLVVVRHPTVLQFAERVESSIRAHQHVLIVNHAPAHRDGSAASYEINACVDSFRAIFGHTPRVAPESGVIRRALEGRLRTPMTTFDWTGSTEVSRHAPRRSDPARAPVLGRHSRDNPEKWPSGAAAIEAAYPVSGWDVRILGGAATAEARLGERPPGWTVYEFGTKEPSVFLDELDFWVYFHDENLIESFGMATVEAMAAGLVVVLPTYMEPTFGTGAVYCEPGDVRRIVEHYWADPAAYQRQSAAGLAVARERFAPDSFERRVEGLLT